MSFVQCWKLENNNLKTCDLSGRPHLFHTTFFCLNRIHILHFASQRLRFRVNTIQIVNELGATPNLRWQPSVFPKLNNRKQTHAASST